ncbi:serine acetyltransferase [Roseomonas nepalensis]|uniref:Serine acetyltransferase n=2 Tax=Muricoccus nepalensis TaxID=1854500 RepID=A0A502F695_9PROT|nr:serine acetyltransferase [Roseomonas nepalensis]
MHQGLWALLQYRVAHAIYRSALPAVVKQPLLVLAVAWQKAVEVTTGISIKYRTRIGTGFYIGHFGSIFVGPDVVIGPMCNISQGVTIGVSGRGERRGYPTLGERVYVGANAIIAGRVTIGDGAVIGANSLVTQDVPPNAVVVGSPLKIISYKGSAAYLDPEAETGA